jgi:hypothetical protein
MNVRCPPKPIVNAHPPDQRSQSPADAVVLGDQWSGRRAGGQHRDCCEHRIFDRRLHLARCRLLSPARHRGDRAHEPAGIQVNRDLKFSGRNAVIGPVLRHFQWSVTPGVPKSFADRDDRRVAADQLRRSDLTPVHASRTSASTARSPRRSFYPRQAGPTGTFQISSAYSRTARSEQNHPTRAVFRMLACHHAARSCQSLPTSRCLA